MDVSNYIFYCFRGVGGRSRGWDRCDRREGVLIFFFILFRLSLVVLVNF